MRGQSLQVLREPAGAALARQAADIVLSPIACIKS
jgi:hypothetical protein